MGGRHPVKFNAQRNTQPWHICQWDKKLYWLSNLKQHVSGFSMATGCILSAFWACVMGCFVSMVPLHCNLEGRVSQTFLAIDELIWEGVSRWHNNCRNHWITKSGHHIKETVEVRNVCELHWGPGCIGDSVRDMSTPKTHPGKPRETSLLMLTVLTYLELVCYHLS